MRVLSQTKKRGLRRLGTPVVMALGFLVIIAAGTLLLTLPLSSADHTFTSPLTAAFTSVSATCVTGLTVVNTGVHWSVFGQAVILCLIQIGGLGFMTLTVLLLLLIRHAVSPKERMMVAMSYNLPTYENTTSLVRRIVTGTFSLELVGAILLFTQFVRYPGLSVAEAVWRSLFTAVSAFCNAGFDLMGRDVPFSSLTGYVGDPAVNVVVILLIVIGGLGFLTWQDAVVHRLRCKEYRLQSKLILVTTAALLLFGFFFFLLYEFRLPQWVSLSSGEKLLAALFQSVTPRTAGFNTVDLARMSEAGQLVTILLMLTGGSPGSTAGGFKTTTLAVLLLSAAAVFRRRRSAQCFGRRVQDSALQSACAIFLLYILLFLTGGILICCIDAVPLMDALFEAASAIGTVGLSLGGSARFSAASRMILIFLMYFGRVGGLTMIYAFTAGNGTPASQFPQEPVTVG